MTDRTIWASLAAPAAGWKPALAAAEIHLWLAGLDSPPRPLAELAAMLAAEERERERAARFRFPEHRDRFIAGRGLLRGLLGAYLDRPAAVLRFEQVPHGKPALAGEETGAGLHFNLAHGGGRGDVKDDLAAGVTALAEGVRLADLAQRLYKNSPLPVGEGLGVRALWMTGFIRPSSMSWLIEANRAALGCTKTKRC